MEVGMRTRRAVQECQRLYAEAVSDVAGIRIVELAPGERAPGWPRKDVIYIEMREDLPEVDRGIL